MADLQKTFRLLRRRTHAAKRQAQLRNTAKEIRVSSPKYHPIESRGFEWDEDGGRTFSIPSGEGTSVSDSSVSLPEGAYFFEIESEGPVSAENQNREIGAFGTQRALLKGSQFTFSSSAEIQSIRYWKTNALEGEAIVGPFPAWGRVSATAESFDCEVAVDEMRSTPEGTLPWSSARLFSRRTRAPEFKGETVVGRLPRDSAVRDNSEKTSETTYFRGAGLAARPARNESPFGSGGLWAWSLEREGVMRGPWNSGLIRPTEEDEKMLASIEEQELPPPSRHLRVEWGPNFPSWVLVRVRGAGHLTEIRLTEKQPSLWPGADDTIRTKTIPLNGSE